jgi:5-methylcytosine-specific restriction endonuclease McrA
MQTLSVDQMAIHERALRLVKAHRKIESQLIHVLQEVDRAKFFKKLGQPSLFAYATQVLGLSESLAYAFITVARKCKEIDQLQAAIDSEQLSVSKAVRITSSLTTETTEELIAFAKVHSSKEIDCEMARRNPKSQVKSVVKPLSENLVEIKLTVSKATYEKWNRAQSLEAQKQKSSKMENVLEAVLDDYLRHHDPVKKAECAKQKAKPCLSKVMEERNLKETSPSMAERRIPLTAEQKHTVFRRDQGKCTHVNASGQRCNQDRWIEVHHIVPLSQGGSNEPENLTTLCSFHHDLVHQLSLPIDGQVTWLRSAMRAYSV